MIYLADTNVLLRFSRHEDPRYQIVQDAMHKLEAEGHQFRTTSQNFAEFWNVATASEVGSPGKDRDEKTTTDPNSS